MSRGHPLRARFGELAAVYEEVAATRAELAVASSRLGKLSPKQPARAASPGARPSTSPARKPRVALLSPAARARGGPPPRGSGAGEGALREQAASRWAQFVEEFERKQEGELLAAQRAAAEAAAESEEES
jgi:hypothetical protein